MPWVFSQLEMPEKPYLVDTGIPKGSQTFIHGARLDAAQTSGSTACKCAIVACCIVAWAAVKGGSNGDLIPWVHRQPI